MEFLCKHMFYFVFYKRKNDLFYLITISLMFVMSSMIADAQQRPIPIVPIQLQENDVTDQIYLKNKLENCFYATFSSLTLSTSNASLISIVHTFSQDGTRSLTANYFLANLQKRMFANDTQLDMEAIYLDQVTENTVAFNLDKYWGRIIYAQKQGTWVRSYGDHQTDYHFWGPRAMVADLSDTLYVADADQQKIIKLNYNRTDGKIYHSKTLESLNLLHPIDIAIDLQGSLAGNPANDHIWIADDFAGKLVDMHRNGQVAQIITQYKVGSTNYPIRHPVKIQTQDNDKIAFIDGDRNAFVIVTRPSPSVVTAVATACNVFSQPSKLTCIGLDVNNEWWVGDETQRQYHHFKPNGEYLCSYNAENTPPGQFASPVSVSKAPYLVQNGQVYRSLYVYTSDLWGDNTGMRAFLPGADITTLTEAGENSCSKQFSIFLTNKSLVYGTLYILSGGNYVQTASYSYGEMSAGQQIVEVDKYTMGSGQYKFKVSVQPYYNAQYASMQGNYNYQQTVTKEMYFSYQPPTDWGAFIDGTVCPELLPLSASYWGTWTVHPPNCNGSFSYQWYVRASSPGSTWSLLSGQTGQTLTYSVLATSPSAKVFDLKCRVIHNVTGGATTYAYFSTCPPPPEPPACPYVYTWDGSQFLEDNNILPQSEYAGNENKDVTDYYRLMKPLQKTNGRYVLQIREFERERSYIDNVKLLAVDHSVHTKIDVAQDGSIMQYKTPNKLRRARFKNNDVTARLLAFDSLKIPVSAGDTLSLDLADSTITMKDDYETIFQAAGGEGGGEGLPKVTKIASIVSPKTANGQQATFTFRQRSTLVFVPMGVSNLRNWKISWDAQANLDYFNYGVVVQTPYTVKELPLVSANHSIDGNMVAELSSTDSVYATLEPAERIEFQFAGLSAPQPGKKRTFILVTRGRYNTIPDSTGEKMFSQEQTTPAVSSFMLHANYPNPFNPVTTISFQTPVEGRAMVQIYNTLGQEVARVFDSEVGNGIYTTEWNAMNASSGIYFCRYTVIGSNGKELFADTKKLLLMR